MRLMSKTCVTFGGGWMSAAIVKYWWSNSPDAIDNNDDKLDFIGYNYGQPIPDLSEYDKVIMCDISFKLTKGQEIDRIAPMFNLIDKFKSNFIWIDHHISAMNDVAEYANEYDYDVSYPIGIRDTKFAACELTWKYFFSNPIDKYGELEEQNPMPEIVRLLGRYDCFGYKPQWKAVNGYEGIYEVSSHGKVRSLDRIIIEEYNKSKHLQGKELSAAISKRGYLVVNLYKNNIGQPP